MKSNISANIDTVEFSVKGERNSFHIQDATTAQLISPDGEVMNRYQNRKMIHGRFGAHSINVRTLHSGSELYIEGSPRAFFSGQNVFTSSEMRRLVVRVLKTACARLEVNPSKEQKLRWGSGDIDLHRVDLAVNFRCKSEEECIDILEQVKRQLIEQRGGVRTHGSTVYWAPKNGKEYSIAFYAKGPQMRQMRRLDGLPYKDQLIAECESILRVEVRLRGRALRDLGLNKVKNWGAGSAERTFRKFMGRLQFLSITSGPVTEEELSELPNRLRPVLALHKLGYDLKKIYEPRTLQRHRSDFKDMGIDLRCPNQNDRSVIPLHRALSPKKAIKKPPAWMVKSGLA